MAAKITINNNVTVPYPIKELAEMKEVLSNYGTLENIKQQFGIDKRTIISIQKTGKGKKKNVDAIREYVKAFKLQTA
jgi:hypothetical protein